MVCEDQASSSRWKWVRMDKSPQWLARPQVLNLYRERPIVYKFGWQSHKPDAQQIVVEIPVLFQLWRVKD